MRIASALEAIQLEAMFTAQVNSPNGHDPRYRAAQACAAVDRAEALSEFVSRDGVMIYAKHGPKAHPALKEELAARAFICRTLQRLGINVEAIKPPGRPAGHAHWTPTP